VKVAAEGIQFVNKELTVKADLPATIVFDNKDKNIVHNVAVASDAEFTQRIFTGDVVPGPRSIDYRFRAPAAGVYFFRCDIHPAMQGKLTVTK
jgi:plastocyanin